MQAINIEKAYEPKTFEARIYNEWEKSGAFKAASDKANFAKSNPNIDGTVASSGDKSGENDAKTDEGKSALSSNGDNSNGKGTLPNDSDKCDKNSFSSSGDKSGENGAKNSEGESGFANDSEKGENSFASSGDKSGDNGKSNFTDSDGGAARKSVFSVVIPPPNVTGVLHMGHALNNTLQDIVVRFHRMRGDDTLWVTGTDHAGIATQNVVEKQLKKEGTNRRELGREAFLERTWAVKRDHHATITKQQRALGNSTDWERERFTLDAGLNRAVKKVFVDLYNKKLLYKGKYLVNYCTRCGTALSDDEVVHSDTKGAMYHIYYAFADDEDLSAVKVIDAKDDEGKVLPSALDLANRRIEIATTRPETLLGDTAVAVNGDDPRYKAIVGKWLKLPLTPRKVKIIADSFVDKSFGTGVVKVTPAHDPNDYAASKRNGLEVINILNPDGTLNDAVPQKYQGLTVQKAREAVVADLESAGLFKEKEVITHSVGHCYRCDTPIEPYLSDQWFVKMEPLAKAALAAWERGDVVFYPRKWENTYKYWLQNIKDWCISRQLWWGHRIPAWTCQKCGKLIVAEEEPKSCPDCASADLKQDEDVLDTWFSSWLWPFSTLGWPEETADLKRFYPTSALVTAYDIIFFWVARMIMAGLCFTGKAPFHDIYIHGLVRDKQGRKMSKSLGNGMDPLDIIDTYGSDALKFTLSFMCAQGQDILIDKDSFKLGSRFCNKVWNASRYLLGSLEGRTFVKITPQALKSADIWVLTKLHQAELTATSALLSYRYNDAASALMTFFWNEFCDWYIEASKIPLRDGSDAERDRQTSVLLIVLEEALRALHPFIPFVTEELYSKLPPQTKTCDRLITARYPDGQSIIDSTFDAKKALETFDATKAITQSARGLKVECAIDPAQKVDIAIKTQADFDAQVIKLMAGVKSIETVTAQPASSIGATGVTESGAPYEVFLKVSGDIDKDKLKAHFEKLILSQQALIERATKKLTPAFIEHAAPEKVAAEKKAQADAQEQIEKLKMYMAEI